MCRLLTAILLLILFPLVSFCQEDKTDTALNKYAASTKFIEKIAASQEALTNTITQQNRSILSKLQKKEERLAQKISKLDSVGGSKLAGDINHTYTDLEKKLFDPAGNKNTGLGGEYIPRMDSLKTMLRFIQPLSGNKEKFDKAIGDVDDLKTRFTQTEMIERFISERSASLDKLLANYTHLPAGITRSVTGYYKQVFYYKQRLASWKESVNSPEKIEEEALVLLNKIPAFKAFWQQQSDLAKLFPVPANYGSPMALTGLQTRTQVQGLLSSQLGLAAGNNATASQYISQQLSRARSALQEVKNKATTYLNAGQAGDVNTTGFKPNNQKTKPFLKRLEYGFDIQNAPGNYLLPLTSDIAAMIGYKWTDKLVTGIGISYKVGWGKPVKNIHVTNEGIGLRSYLDIKLIKSTFITGGFEYNHMQQFKKYAELYNISTWQKSGLIGVSRKYKVANKTGKIQVLWDFLSYHQVPKTSPVKFRVGYIF